MWFFKMLGVMMVLLAFWTWPALFGLFLLFMGIILLGAGKNDDY